MNKLDELASKREQILLAEIGALIHDLGKLSSEFVLSKGEYDNEDSFEESTPHFLHHNVLRLHSRGRVLPLIEEFEKCSKASYECVYTMLVESANPEWATKLAERRKELTDKIRHRIKAELKKARSKAVNIVTKRGGDRNALASLIRELQQKEVYQPVRRCIAEIRKDLGDPTSHDYRLRELKKVRDSLMPIPELEEAKDRYVAPIIGHYKLLQQEKAVPKGFIGQENLACLLHEIRLKGQEEFPLSDYIELHHTDTWHIPYLVRLLRASGGGADGFDSWIDKQVAKAKQIPRETYIATAFGYESQRVDFNGLTAVRQRYANTLAQKLQKIKAANELEVEAWNTLICDPKSGLRARTEAAFRQALGETRRAANDVTLWDHCYSTASLYKASLSKVLLEKALDEEYDFPSPSTIGWRFLRVGVDGLDFFGQAHHVTDMLGRRDVLVQVLDEVRYTLEVEYPLGNEIYRDENGSVFVMPALGDDADHRALAEEVNSQVEEAFRQMGQRLDVGSELMPRLTWNDEGAVRGMDDDKTLPDMRRAFGKLVSQTPGDITADPQAMDAWWRESQSAKKEICTVCGVRPVGYRPPDVEMPGWVDSGKAEKRHVCCVCLNRRGRRAQKWLRRKPHTTIWADEVVDVNGRFALIVGRFDLDQWLEGTLVRTMLIAFQPEKEIPEERYIPKNPSPARVRRCWETTRKFWQEIEPKAILGKVGKRTRLEIIPRNKKELLNSLGAYHTYELDISGQRMGVVWDPISKHLLITEHLADLVRRWNITVEDGDTPFTALQRWLQRRPYKTWSLYEPSGYGEPAREKEQDVVFDDAKGSEIPYTPYIPLLTEPALFMSLIPADKAMEVVQAIKEKYEREMSKVQDRLPLHLGVVIAQRRTPLRAMLEAGRDLLGARGKGLGTGGWEKWRVKESPEKRGSDDAPEYLTQDNRHFEEWWDVTLRRNGREMTLRISTVMGDGGTPDQWYPHLLKRPLAPGEALDAETDLVHVKSLNENDEVYEVYIAPSTFDFEYLDTTARRFEIAYDDEGRRRGSPIRPYLLSEIDDLQRVWGLISERLTTAQWMALDGLIERKRQEWSEPGGPSADRSEAFEDLVDNALRNADWRWEVEGETKNGWRELTESERDLLEKAAREGVLNDVINLYHEAMKEKSEEA